MHSTSTFFSITHTSGLGVVLGVGLGVGFDVTFGLSVLVFFVPAPSKALFATFTPSGTKLIFSFLQFMNACFPISFSLEFLEILTFSSLVHSAKAFFPIVCTESGSVTVFSFFSP